MVIDRELSNMNDIVDITSTTAKEEGGRDVVIAAMVEEEEEDDDDGDVAVLVVENNDSNVVNNDGRINDNNYCMVNIDTLPTSPSSLSSYDDGNDENDDEGRRERTRRYILELAKKSIATTGSTTAKRAVTTTTITSPAEEEDEEYYSPTTTPLFDDTMDTATTSPFVDDSFDGIDNIDPPSITLVYPPIDVKREDEAITRITTESTFDEMDDENEEVIVDEDDDDDDDDGEVGPHIISPAKDDYYNGCGPSVVYSFESTPTTTTMTNHNSTPTMHSLVGVIAFNNNNNITRSGGKFSNNDNVYPSGGKNIHSTITPVSTTNNNYEYHSDDDDDDSSATTASSSNGKNYDENNNNNLYDCVIHETTMTDDTVNDCDINSINCFTNNNSSNTEDDIITTTTTSNNKKEEEEVEEEEDILTQLGDAVLYGKTPTFFTKFMNNMNVINDSFMNSCGICHADENLKNNCGFVHANENLMNSCGFVHTSGGSSSSTDNFIVGEDADYKNSVVVLDDTVNAALLGKQEVFSKSSSGSNISNRNNEDNNNDDDDERRQKRAVNDELISSTSNKLTSHAELLKSWNEAKQVIAGDDEYVGFDNDGNIKISTTTFFSTSALYREKDEKVVNREIVQNKERFAEQIQQLSTTAAVLSLDALVIQSTNIIEEDRNNNDNDDLDKTNDSDIQQHFFDCESILRKQPKHQPRDEFGSTVD